MRGGADNDEVLTEYTGTVPGDVDAEASSRAAGGRLRRRRTQITDDGELREADAHRRLLRRRRAEITYTVTLDDYGTEKDITAP